jgi:hypothetical protein
MEGALTIAIATRQVRPAATADAAQREARPPRSRRRRLIRRILFVTGGGLLALIALVAAWVGIGLYKIDHAVHHVGVPASLLAKGKNDLLAVVKGPDHSEQIFVFHDTGARTNVLKIPSSLQLPLGRGRTVPIETLSLHSPDALIAGLGRVGIPVSHYVGVDLHMVSPGSSLGQLATGKLSVTSLISDPTGTTSLLEQVASHIYLGPGTPVSAVLSLMHVPAAHPLSVPTSANVHGRVVLASGLDSVLRNFL